MAVLADDRGLEDQLARLRDRHEVPGDVRVRDGERTAGAQLLAERVQHGAARAQDVAEAHGQVGAREAARVLRDEALAQSLAATQLARGCGGLVRRDVHEGGDAGRAGRLEDIERAVDVRLPPLQREALEHRQVLEGRRVEHDVGLRLGEDPVQRIAIADVRQHRVRRREQCGPADGQLDAVQRGLVAVQHDEGRGLERVQLAAQLAADRPAGARHEDAPTGDRLTDLRQVRVQRAAADEVLDPQPADVAQLDRARHEFAHGRDRPHPHPGAGQPIAAGAQECGIRLCDRDDDAAHAHALGDLPQFLGGAQDAQSLLPEEALLRVVIDESHGVEAAGLLCQHLAGEGQACIAGAHHQDGHSGCGTARAVVGRPDDVPAAAHEGERAQGRQEHESGRLPQHRTDDQTGHEDRCGGRPQLAEAAEEVAAPVQPQHAARQDLHDPGQHEHGHQLRDRHVVRSHQRPRPRQCGRPGGAIEDRLQSVPARPCALGQAMTPVRTQRLGLRARLIRLHSADDRHDGPSPQGCSD